MDIDDIIKAIFNLILLMVVLGCFIYMRVDYISFYTKNSDLKNSKWYIIINIFLLVIALIIFFGPIVSYIACKSNANGAYCLFNNFSIETFISDNIGFVIAGIAILFIYYLCSKYGTIKILTNLAGTIACIFFIYKITQGQDIVFQIFSIFFGVIIFQIVLKLFLKDII